MGNVYASANPKSSTTDFKTLSPEDPTLLINPEEKLENPGTLDDLHKKCKDVFPINFEGAKIVVQKGLSNHFQISHSLSLSSLSPGYRFGATYVGTKQYGPGEVFPVLVGDIDPAGNLNANIYHKFTENLMSKVQAQFQNSKCAAAQYTLDYRGSNFTATATLANPDLPNVSGVFVGHYLQSITRKTDLGVELAYQRNPSIPGSQVAVTSLAARYTEEDWTGGSGGGARLPPSRSRRESSSREGERSGNVGRQLRLSLVRRAPLLLHCHPSPVLFHRKFNYSSDFVVSSTLGMAGVNICYYQRASPQLQLGVEFETNLRVPESSATIGYQVDIPKADLVFKGMVDTNWNVGATLDKKLTPMPFNLTLSALLNHQKNQFRLGIGFIIG